MRLRRLAGLFMVAAAFSGLSQTAAAPAIWIDVPFTAQTKDGCGSASLAMVMQYWEHQAGQPTAPDADPLKIQAALFSPSAKGIYASSMQRYLRDAGYRVFAFDGTWDDLRHHLALGRPLIVSLKASGPHGPLHYVVVVGLDSKRGYVYVNDPAQQKMLRISRQGFESEWSYTRHWTLLAVPETGRQPGH